jgi:hypothetical protein
MIIDLQFGNLAYVMLHLGTMLFKNWKFAIGSLKVSYAATRENRLCVTWTPIYRDTDGVWRFSRNHRTWSFGSRTKPIWNFTYPPIKRGQPLWSYAYPNRERGQCHLKGKVKPNQWKDHAVTCRLGVYIDNHPFRYGLTRYFCDLPVYFRWWRQDHERAARVLDYLDRVRRPVEA